MRVFCCPDSVLLYTGFDEDPLENYRFDSVCSGTLFDHMEFATIHYIYSDEDPSLADNQLYLILTVTSLDGFKDSPYTMELQSFGYYDSFAATGDSVSITTVYKGPWAFKLDLSGDTYEYNIESVYITPFTCTTVISYDGDPNVLSERFTDISDAVSDLAFYTGDGISIEQRKVTVNSGGTDHPDSTCHVTTSFEIPTMRKK